MLDADRSDRLLQDLAEAALYQAARQYSLAADDAADHETAAEMRARERMREKALCAAAVAYCAVAGPERSAPPRAGEGVPLGTGREDPLAVPPPEWREPDAETRRVAAQYGPATASRLLRLARVLPPADTLQLLTLMAGVAEETSARDAERAAQTWHRILAHVPGMAPALEAVHAHVATGGECAVCAAHLPPG